MYKLKFIQEIKVERELEKVKNFLWETTVRLLQIINRRGLDDAVFFEISVMTKCELQDTNR